MALLLVVHHQRDSQPCVNAWLDDDRLQAITTTGEIAKLCAVAQSADEQVFVHRCGWDEKPPSICCAVRVARVAKLSDGESYVEFEGATPLDRPPPLHPSHGQNFYEAHAVEVEDAER